MAAKKHVQIADLKPGDRFIFDNKQHLVTDKRPLVVEVYSGKVTFICRTTFVEKV